MTHPSPTVRDVAQICRALAASDLIPLGPSGNVSSRSLASVTFTKTGTDLRQSGYLETTGVVSYPLDRLIDAYRTDTQPDGPLTTEWQMHMAVYANANGAVRHVAHTHSHAVVAASCLALTKLPLVHYYQAHLGAHPTPFVPFHLYGSRGLAAAVETAVRENPSNEALILSNHGGLVWGETPEQTAFRALVLEQTCDHYLTSLNATVPHRLLTDFEIARTREAFRTYKMV
jgi:ribulose-5-phosphate 4-epimerase/fuculose-1-phosphate aldolase